MSRNGGILWCCKSYLMSLRDAEEQSTVVFFNAAKVACRHSIQKSLGDFCEFIVSVTQAYWSFLCPGGVFRVRH